MKWFRLILFTILQIFVTTIIVGAFFGLPYALYICKTQPGLSVTFGIVLLLSLAFGRYFCQALCPLGAIQDFIALIFHPKTKTRRVCTRLPRSNVQMIVSWTIVLVAVLTASLGGLALFDPCGILGRFTLLFVGDAGDVVLPTIERFGVGYFVLAIGVFAVVVVAAAFGKGRCWCNWICPMGTVFAFVARFSFFKDRVGLRCQHCRKCFAQSQSENSKPNTVSVESTSGITRRESLKGVAVLAVAEKLTDGGYAEVVRANSPAISRHLLPPGALWGEKRFAATCVGCQLCVAHCPSKCLKPVTWSGQVGMDFRDGYCIQNCTKCSEVCPMDAMKKLSVLEKRNVHIGVANWRQDLCLRSKGEKCQACIRKCPVDALHLVGETIVVDKDACVGCGACEHVCAARPEAAIVVNGLNRQRFCTPMSEADLFAEMKRLVEHGESLVIARDGVIRDRLVGGGVKPTLEALDQGKLAKAMVCDKVIGRAAAAIFIVGKANKVWAKVMSEDAMELLRKHGIECSAETIVKKILNRDRTDRCPLEKSADGISQPKKIIEKVRSILI